MKHSVTVTTLARVGGLQHQAVCQVIVLVVIIHRYQVVGILRTRCWAGEVARVIFTRSQQNILNKSQ